MTETILLDGTIGTAALPVRPGLPGLVSLPPEDALVAAPDTLTWRTVTYAPGG